MKVSKVIAALQAVQEEHGDLEVLFPIKIEKDKLKCMRLKIVRAYKEDNNLPTEIEPATRIVVM